MKKPKPELDPDVADDVPWSDNITPYDDQHTITYLRLLDAIDAGEQITVYTDFDVDGVSAGAQLFLYLRALGAKVNTYTPSRFAEGYGLVCAAVEKLAKLAHRLPRHDHAGHVLCPRRQR